MNNGTYAATTLGDAMSYQSSGSFEERTDENEAAGSDTEVLALLAGERVAS